MNIEGLSPALSPEDAFEAFWAADDQRVDALENEPNMDLVTMAIEKARQAGAKLAAVRGYLGDLAYEGALALEAVGQAA